MKLKTIYEDKDILVIDKPAGVEVTELPLMPAHRLDKDTSGLMVLAKNEVVLKKLQEQFKNRQVEKEYLALVYGELEPKTGELVTIIVRHPKRRVPFQAVAVPSGLERGSPRIAKTAWRVLKTLSNVNSQMSFVRVKITTGRTHQIRVHMAYLGHPVLGDKIYSTKQSKKASELLGLTRQFLHASKLSFVHPVTNKKMDFESGLPKDLELKNNPPTWD